MKKTSFSCWPFRAVVSGLLVLCCFVPAFGGKPISSGIDLPQFMLSAPDAEDARKYLGLKNAKPFALSQVPAKLIILDVFYVLCLECQKQAPDINKIYELMQQDPELEKNIRIIGIGIRSSREKLRAFKTSFRVKFPLIPDEDNTVYSKVGEPPIPFLILVNDKGRVLLTHQGPFKNVEEFFSQIKKLYKVR